MGRSYTKTGESGIGQTMKVRRIACYTDEQQKMYEALLPKHRLYVDLRSQGYSKVDSYVGCGYSRGGASQAAANMEKLHPEILELVEVRLRANSVANIFKSGTDISNQVDALATQKSAEEMLDMLNHADAETFKRIKFYREILEGKIKTVKKTTITDDKGKKTTKVEEISDVATRIQARKELDRILGLNRVVDLGSVQMGDITINIVDASKKEEVADERNNGVMLDPSKEIVEENGDRAVVVEEVTQRKRGRPPKQKPVVDFDK